MTIELLGSEPEPRRPRTGLSGWEIALWAIGVVLVGAGVVVVVELAQTINEESTSTFVNTNATPAQIFLQTSVVVAPGLFIGGVVCIALAIFARVLDAHARHRSMVAPGAAVSAAQDAAAPVAPLLAAASPSAPSTAAPSPSAPSTAADAPAAPTAQPTDYSAFMRPPDESTDNHTDPRP
jgi:hypothetical protein